MISVIVPVYNVEKYLRKCLDSIINQTYKDLEIILVDDGSPDNCGRICDEYAEQDARVRVIHQENKGVSAARNIGVATAKGDYITFVDSDDYIELDTYEKVKVALDEYNPQLVFFREQSVNEKGEIIHINGLEPTGNVWGGDQKDAADLIIKRLINGMCDKVYKADILKELAFEEGKMYGEDFMCNLLALTRVKRIAYIDQIQYSYVSNQNSITHQGFNPNTFDQIYFKDSIADFVKEYFPDYEEICRKRSFLARLRIMRPIYAAKVEKQYKEEIRVINQYLKSEYRKQKKALSKAEKIEYFLYMHCKFLYKIMIKIINKRRK